MEFIVVPIKRHISYPFIYKSKVETLHREAEQLKNKRLKLQQSVDEATRKGEEIYESVNKWMNDAGKAIEEAEEFIQGEEQAKKSESNTRTPKNSIGVADVLGLTFDVEEYLEELIDYMRGLPLYYKVAKTYEIKCYAWKDMRKQLSEFDRRNMQNYGLSNIPIRSLLKYVMGLSLFKHISTVKEARNKVYTLIDTLKAKCLLIDGDTYGFVKIHDVVRDTALSIASREQHAFIDLFFKGIRNLEVVDFTGMRFVSLPSSLAFLSNVHTLCLHRCQLDDIAIIGDLKQLRVLSFANSYIVELPGQIEHLTRLKLLDVSDCSKLKMIPANALSKLSQLEALYMSNSFDRWEADGIRNQGNASLAELEYLSHLMTLEIQILDANILPKHLFSNGLQSYRILIGDGWDWNGNYETSRMLKLKLKTSIHSEYGVKVLLRETEDLYLDEVRGAENVLYDIDGDGFPQLKHLHVQNNTVIQHIINRQSGLHVMPFPF
ncbi:hypothetical protein GH714_012112 [Hevea brasiliensis]|uniref:Rx N-terminal domain-containing protein n=1 Tax=Hevea brasiliensis TaxID=3981 RepID=A0A6A6KZL1_HEVBR|nr:hypothetical protein GH714_012112 [Hevea brasiliensis]